MSGVYRLLANTSWGLGVLGTVAGVVFKVAPVLQDKTSFSAHSAVILAGALFLCSLASREMGRATA